MEVRVSISPPLDSTELIVNKTILYFDDYLDSHNIEISSISENVDSKSVNMQINQIIYTSSLSSFSYVICLLYEIKTMQFATPIEYNE